MANHPTKARHLGRRCITAVVLGTALTATGVPQALANRQDGQNAQVIQNISRYCSACWKNARLPADQWQDCTQEVFSRLMQNLTPRAWEHVFKNESNERQEFLRAIDAVKKRTQRRNKKSIHLTDFAVADPRSHAETQRHDEREMVRQAASDVLTNRQQQILKMSFEGWSVQDIAESLQIPAERVSDEKYKAIRKLRSHFQVA